MRTLYRKFVEGTEKLHDVQLLLFRIILAMSTEVLGIVLLTLGFGSRVIALPMMFVMVVAIFTTHISNGFAAGDNGFEIPLYYFLMLFALVVYGSGKFSLDYLIANRSKETNPAQSASVDQLVGPVKGRWTLLIK